jgi:hypothetical protein
VSGGEYEVLVEIGTVCPQKLTSKSEYKVQRFTYGIVKCHGDLTEVDGALRGDGDDVSR